MKKWMKICLGTVISFVVIYLLFQFTRSIDNVYPKSTSVFGVKIYATKNVPDEKIEHAKAILAEYLDNDEDGVPDNEEVVKSLVNSKAGMVISKDEKESKKIMIFNAITITRAGKFQDLYASEIRPNGALEGMFDGSYEEILHLITQHGYAKVYPEVFGEKAGSQIANIMDKARGGHFKKVPKKYPENAWYTYYDSTADYGTMITEYMYWSLTSILGAQDYEGRINEINEEWKPNTKEKVMNKDPEVYKLLTDSKYKFPTKLPDGNYKVSAK